MMKKKINTSISHKLFINLLLVCAIFLTFFGFWSFCRTKAILRNEIEKSSQNLFKEKKKSFEVIIGEIADLITDISSMEDIKAVLINDKNEMSEFDILSKQEKINYILSGFINFDGIESIHIYSKNGQLYHAGDYLGRQEYTNEEKQNIYNEIIASGDQILWNGIEGNKNSKSKCTNMIMIAKILEKVDKSTLIKQPIGLLIVNYDIDAFCDHFDSINEDDMEYMILDKNNTIVYNQEKSKIGSKPDKGLLTNLKNSSGSFTCNIEGVDKYVIYNKSIMNSWIMVALIPEKCISSKLNGFMVDSIIQFVGLIFILIIFTMVFSRKFVKPIIKITKYFKETQNGNIDFKIDMDKISDDEIGELYNWFNEFVKNLEQKRQAERELVMAKEAAEAASINKSQFLANMSHEIRTPLNGVIGFLELLARTPMDREQANYFSQVKDSTDSLIYVINDILDFSKMEAGKLLIENISFNLHRLVEEVVYLFFPVANKKGVNIYSYIADGVPVVVLGDPGRLRQVFYNLISNAVKFTEEGEVSFYVSALKECEGKVLVQFEIKDTGIGMSDETKEKLFQGFMQADASTTRKYGGTGLGLAITNKIVELLQGDIRVISEPNKGSTFIINIEFEKRQIEENKETPINLKNINLMIVENDERNLFIFQKYLGDTGCIVTQARDGFEALEKLNKMSLEELPQVILVDYHMPKISGIEFGRQVLKDYKYIKLIMIASSAQKGDTELVKNNGFLGYLSKPIRRMELLGVISEVIASGSHEAKEKVVTRYSILEQRHSSKGAKILLVEDIMANQKLEMIVLKKLGYNVELSSDGKQAVELCDIKKFDLILMDCQMPIMDGYEATEFIKKNSILNKNTPIIAMTAHALEGDRDKCIAAGMVDYISKPLVMATLEEILYKYLKTESNE